jgi:hypothetical protein
MSVPELFETQPPTSSKEKRPLLASAAVNEG